MPLACISNSVDFEIFYIHNSWINQSELDQTTAELQIRGGIQDNSKIMFLISLNENLCCDHSLELSPGNCSNDGS